MDLVILLYSVTKQRKYGKITRKDNVGTKQANI